MARLSVKNLISAFLGGLFGTVAFLVFCTYWIGQPFGDWFMSAHGIIGSNELAKATTEDRVELYKLLNRGLIITSDGVLSQMAALYGNLIQVLIGAFALITVLGFFAVRWQSIQAAEDYVDKRTKEYFSSSEFGTLVSAEVQAYVDQLDPDTNPNIFSPRMTALRNEVADLQNQVQILQSVISRNASSEEDEGYE